MCLLFRLTDLKREGNDDCAGLEKWLVRWSHRSWHWLCSLFHILLQDWPVVLHGIQQHLACLLHGMFQKTFFELWTESLLVNMTNPQCGALICTVLQIVCEIIIFPLATGRGAQNHSVVLDHHWSQRCVPLSWWAPEQCFLFHDMQMCVETGQWC